VPLLATCLIGAQSASLAAVWLEEEASQEIIGKKIRVAGLAKLGFLEK
jgi:hypothetical protein